MKTLALLLLLAYFAFTIAVLALAATVGTALYRSLGDDGTEPR